MGIFGKLLLVVNVLGAAGFAYLATQDWKGRQAITAAGLRHLILIQGVPLAGGPDAFPPRVPASGDNFADFAATEVEFRGVEGPGGVPTATVSPELLYVYFNQVGNDAASPLAGTTPVASQAAEVKRVYTLIKDAINKQDGPAVKAQAAAAWLLYQPETLDERTEVLENLATGNASELTHLLDLKFYQVAPQMVDAGPINAETWAAHAERIQALQGQKEAAEKAVPAAETAAASAEKEADAIAGTDAVKAERLRGEAFQKRTEAIAKRAEVQILTRKIERSAKRTAKDQPELRSRTAHLLVHLDTNPTWQKRTLMVVGMRQYVKAVAAQAVRFRDMALQVEQAIADDQNAFVSQYARFRALSIQRTQLVRDMAEVRAQWEVQVQKDKDFVAQRETQLAGMKDQLAKVRVEVDTLLARQSLMEQRLFAVEREVGQTLEDIYRMEAELAKKERAVYGK